MTFFFKNHQTARSGIWRFISIYAFYIQIKIWSDLRLITHGQIIQNPESFKIPILTGTEILRKIGFNQCKDPWCSRIINFDEDTFKILIKKIIFQPLHVVPDDIWIKQPYGYILLSINGLFILIKLLNIAWQSLIFLFIDYDYSGLSKHKVWLIFKVHILR